jgi:aryl-alcohol dehydrogenase-like predicted oxidoreductase
MAMPYRILGRTGVKVFPLCLGTINFGYRTPREQSFEMMDAYVASGGNFIDTANSYSDGRTEALIGDWMKERGTRDRVVLSTKVWNRRSEHVNDQGCHRWHIVREVENSLRRLKTDRIDLYHIHRPDPDTPVDQTLRALDDLVRAGKVVYIASCRLAGWQLSEAHFLAEKMGTARFEVEQAQLNIIDRRMENEVLPFCRKYGMGATCWGPVAKGRLCGTYTRGGRRVPEGTWYAEHQQKDFPAPQWPIMEGVDRLADARGCTSGQFALAWVLQVAGVTSAIMGPRTMEQFRENMGALELRLTEEELRAVDALNPVGNLAWDLASGPVPR